MSLPLHTHQFYLNAKELIISPLYIHIKGYSYKYIYIYSRMLYQKYNEMPNTKK